MNPVYYGEEPYFLMQIRIYVQVLILRSKARRGGDGLSKNCLTEEFFLTSILLTFLRMKK